MSAPDPKLDALGLVPGRVPTDALLAEAARERAEELARVLGHSPRMPDAACPGPGMIHPGFADTRDLDSASLALASVFGAALAVIAAVGLVFVAGAVCHATLGWPGVAAALGLAACGAAWAMLPRGST